MVRYLTTNGKSGTYECRQAFALRYRRVNATFYETVNIDELARSRKMLFPVIPAKAGIQSLHVLLDFCSPNAAFGDRLRRE
jgi:hypothetical protein